MHTKRIKLLIFCFLEIFYHLISIVIFKKRRFWLAEKFCWYIDQHNFSRKSIYSTIFRTGGSLKHEWTRCWKYNLLMFAYHFKGTISFLLTQKLTVHVEFAQTSPYSKDIERRSFAVWIMAAAITCFGRRITAKPSDLRNIVRWLIVFRSKKTVCFQWLNDALWCSFLPNFSGDTCINRKNIRFIS